LYKLQHLDVRLISYIGFVTFVVKYIDDIH
ncbi:MAG: hypothetical protein K0Q94_3060, partial [Paenibacillus sp.]|nr:hypothetical protein [Paenibacillus sp.]